MSVAKSNIYRLVLIISTAVFGFTGRCDEQHSLSLRLSAGPSTYKSKLLESNDTGFLTGFSLGIFGGSEQELEMLIRYDGCTTSFAYADSTLTSSVAMGLQDTILMYHLGPFYLGLDFGRSQFLSSNRGEKYLNTIATGYGVNSGIKFETGKGSGVEVDVSYLSMTNTVDSVQVPAASTVAVGPRMDIYIGGSMDYGKHIYFSLGYMQRTFSIKVGASSGSEIQTATIASVGFEIN